MIFDKIFSKIFGTRHERYVKSLKPALNQILQAESAVLELDDSQLAAKTDEFRSKLENGSSLDNICVEAFAVCRETCDRRLGMLNVLKDEFDFDSRQLNSDNQALYTDAKQKLEDGIAEWDIHLPSSFYKNVRELYPESVKPFRMRSFDVQLIGGLVLHKGSIAEMQTGEGKTLAAACPVYLNAISGKGVHVVTVNDYLAERDAQNMGKAYRFLGLKVGLIVNNLDHDQRKESYAADVTYGTNNEFGFDYLRDNMATSNEELVQRDLNYCIVDEIDSILIDEARTPLIISGPAEQSTDKYLTADQAVRKLKKEQDFTVDEKARNVFLTDEGVQNLERILGVTNLYGNVNSEWVHHIQQSLKAHHIFVKDVDYIVKDDQVVIIDENTGRTMEGRRYSEGLHQALEAKEGVTIARENQTLATITFQNFFRMYNKLSGMTGTADTEATEFAQIYNLGVVSIPTHRPVIRKDQNDKIYKTEKEKLDAIVADIKERNTNGQPVLVGTPSIEKSEQLASFLKRAGVKFDLLNAKQHEREANIIDSAGQPGRVTIATNMAGRGTDIALGEGVREMGGLYVLATERHESRRIDNQLRGRSGRQGDPGESCYYLSLDDTLMRIFGSDRIKGMMDRLGAEEGEVITHPFVNKAILNAQKRVEGQNFESRKHLLEYDDVMNEQRKVIYGLRRKILDGENIKDEFLSRVEEAVNIKVSEFIIEGVYPEDWDLDTLNKELQRSFSIDANLTHESLSGKSAEDLLDQIIDHVKEQYGTLEEKVGEQIVRDLERRVLLITIDQHYKEHLYGMDHLRDSIRFHGYAQKDPLMVYKKEGFSLFEQCLDNIALSSVERLCNVKVEERAPMEEPEPEKPVQAVENREEIKQAESRPMVQNRRPPVKRKPVTVKRSAPKVGRNDPCWCGSGKKFKHCHGAN